MQPFSRGRVTIVSSDPVAEPLVEFEMLEDGRDLDRLRAGVRHAIEMYATARSRPCWRISSNYPMKYWQMIRR
jgi:hypothetical protein